MAHEHTARGVLQGLLLLALTVPEAWQDAPGGLNGPLVLVGAYLLVRCVHLTLYGVAATADRGLRRQLAITSGPLLAGAALLIAGALVEGWTQTLLFAAALLVDWPARRRRPATACRAGRPGAHHGRPDRGRDHPVCAARRNLRDASSPASG